MIYFSKTWWEGENRDEPGAAFDPQPDIPPPKYRPGWTIRYNHRGKSHVGVIRYVLRGTHIDFYAVTRTKNQAEEITFDCSITGRETP